MEIYFKYLFHLFQFSYFFLKVLFVDLWFDAYAKQFLCVTKQKLFDEFNCLFI